ncbi:MAG: response regulator [Candidatus Cloacimonetes bacterium]|nr:response regulator [Candidatus Cloacimonadota bacterium]
MSERKKYKMKPFSFKKIQKKLTFWFLVLAFAPFILGLMINYFQRTTEIKAASINKLTAIRELKVDQVNNWITEREGDLKMASSDYELTALEDLSSNDQYNLKDMELLSHSRKILLDYLNNFPDYQEIFIMNPHTGKITVSTKKAQEGEDKSGKDYFIIPLQKKDIYVSEIFYSRELLNYSMAFSIPIKCTRHNGEHIVGILVARVNLDYSLFPLLMNRTGLGESGETLIVNEDVVAQNELRWYDNAPLHLQITAEPAIRAARGETGTIYSRDYRGEKTLASYTFIKNPGWGFVCKQDYREINAPVRAMTLNLLILLLLSGIGIYFSASIISRSISRPVVEMNKMAKKITEGDYSARLTVKSSNELVSLSDSINVMAATLASRAEVQKNVTEIAEIMIGRSTLKGFASRLLPRLLVITGSEMGAFYILNEEKEQFEHYISVGTNKELLRSFSAVHPEGEFGTVIAAKRIFWFQDIPENTIFKYITVAGTAIPRELISIPVLLNEQVVAVISLAKLSQYSEASLEALNLSWNTLNQTYGNLLNSEKNRLLAEHLTRSNQQLEVQTEELQEQTEELQAQAEELQSQAEELMQNADELHSQNIELELQKRQVMQANKLKSEFLSNMSHELRTPLNSILALSKIVLLQTQGKITPEETKYLEIVNRNGKRLLDLINDILDLSKIEAGKMDLHPVFISLEPVLENIRESISPLAQEKNIEVKLEISQKLPIIETDEGKVYQILQNIVGNAVKFTEKGYVSITAEHDRENIYVKVADTGIGIAKDDIAHIFEEFRQVDGSSSRFFEGTGLGLTIAYKLVKMLGGDIIVESILKKGSLFTVIIPAQWQGEIDYTEPEFLKSIPANQQETKLTAGKSRLLLVEDNEASIIQIRNELQREGYIVDVASGGQQALDYVKRVIPDGIILDLMMPEIDGFEVLENIRNTEKTRQIPVLILTAKDLDRSDLAKLSANHVQQLVQKGNIDLQGLLTKIKLLLGNIPGSEIIKEDQMMEDPENNLPEILIVEDNPDNMTTLKAMIGGKYRLREAQDGLQGLKSCVNCHPDLVLLDISLPVIDGIEVIGILKGSEETKHIPVIAVTARAMKEDEQELLQAGCDDYLAKPVNPELLLQKLQKWLQEL